MLYANGAITLKENVGIYVFIDIKNVYQPPSNIKEYKVVIATTYKGIPSRSISQLQI